VSSPNPVVCAHGPQTVSAGGRLGKAYNGVLLYDVEGL
jgi:hypothetical protein